MSHDLTPFEGVPVISTKIKVTKAGDGLSSALRIEPVEYERGEKIYLVLEGNIGAISFLSAGKDAPDSLVRLHTFETELATVVDGSKVKALLADQRRRIEEAEGVAKLPGMDEDDEAEDSGE